MNKSYIVIMILIYSITNVVALQVNYNSFDIKKIYNQPYNLNLTITNNENQELYNISFQKNNYINSSTINELPKNSSAILYITVTANTNLNTTERLKSFYYNNIGTRNLTHNLNINRDMNVNTCSFSIIKGDSVIMKNTETSSYVGQIALRQINKQDVLFYQNSSKTFNFNNPTTFKYQLFSWPVNSLIATCQINILDDSDYVNNPINDVLIKFNVKTIYKNTALSYVISNSNYSMKFYNEQDGFITITNKGNDAAKNIHLNSNSNWFSFSINNFDLQPGYTKNIAFKINPIISNTNETAKQYIKSILVTGNFPKMIIPIKIFIDYSEVSNNSQVSNKSFTELVTEFCLKNPDICNSGSKVVYVNGNNSDNLFNATLGQKQLQRLFTTILISLDNQNRTNNYWKHEFNEFNKTLYNASNNAMLTKAATTKIQMDLENNNSIWIFFGIILSAILIGGLLVYLANYYKKLNDMKQYNRYG